MLGLARDFLEGRGNLTSSVGERNVAEREDTWEVKLRVSSGIKSSVHVPNAGTCDALVSVEHRKTAELCGVKEVRL